MKPSNSTPAMRPAIDFAVIDGLRGWYGPERGDQFTALCRAYSRETDTLIEAMDDRARRDDRRGVARFVHRLLGSSGTVGAASLCEMCTEIETDGQLGSGDLSSIVSVLAAEQHRFAAELEGLLGSESGGAATYWAPTIT